MTEKILGKNGVSVIRDVIKDKADSVHTHTASDITDFPEIPTEKTVEKWGFTKNSGDYSKPADGIPKADLSSDVQASLDKADTALQSYTEEYITGRKLISEISMQGSFADMFKVV